MSRLFIRTSEWWYHKIPLPLLVLLLLGSGRLLSPDFALACGVVIVIVSAVANFGHAVNDIYDRAEDAANRRENAAIRHGAGVVRTVAIVSAGLALACAYLAAGIPAALLTLCALSLPLAYSRPPIRLKQRLWLGVLADALAAHVYPATLSLLITATWHLGPVTIAITLAALLWSLMMGLRAILSHQIYTEAADQKGGLRTVVHALGARMVTRLVLGLMLPLELAAFGTLVLSGGVGTGAPFIVLCAGLVFLLWEGRHLVKGTKQISFSAQGLFFFPGLSNTFYTVWAAAALMVAAGMRHPLAFAYLAAYVGLFWLNLREEFVSGVDLGRIVRRREPTPAELAEQIALLRLFNAVDDAWYRRQYGLDASANPAEDYCRSGWRQGRDPNPDFSTVQYLLHHRDVVIADFNPLVHFLRWGRSEGRMTWPSNQAQR